MSDAGALLLGLGMVVGMVSLGLIVGRAMGQAVGSIRSLADEFSADLALMRRSQERIERRLGLQLGSSPVDPAERHPRVPPEPPNY